jgi:hypothetical protein
MPSIAFDLDPLWAFDAWFEEAYPDGDGNGYGGDYCAHDLESAFIAGYLAGRLDPE